MLFLLKNPSNGVVIRNARDPISDDGDDYGNSSNKTEYILLSPHNKFSIMIIIIIMMMIRRNSTIQSPMEMSKWNLDFLLIIMLPPHLMASFFLLEKILWFLYTRLSNNGYFNMDFY